MKSWVCHELSGEDGLRLDEQDPPQCADGQVQIRNVCAALNFPDVLITRGQYQMKLEPPFIPGSEFAGIVSAVGQGVENLDVGQRVLALSGFGAFSEEVVVSPPMQQVHAIPDSMPFEEAAAFSMTYGTGIHALKQRGYLAAGETLLVLGSAGGCGSAAIQIGKAMGAKVIAGASTDEKCQLAAKLGADSCINYSTENLRDRVMEETSGQGADVVFDPVGGGLFEQAKRCAGWNGRYLVIGFAGGDIPSLPINYTLIKSFSLIGVAYGMSAINDPAMNEGNFTQLFQWYEQGLLKPYIGRQYTLEQLPDACRELHEGMAMGKTLVKFSRD